jgi:hydrogenase-4 component B
MNSLALVASFSWPVVLVLGLLWRPGRALARSLAPWAALPALLSGLAGAPALEIGWLLLGGRVGFDEIAVLLLPATAGLWLAAGLFAHNYLDAGPARDRFFGCFLAAMAGNMLLLVALDAIVFYLGFAVMSFASYGLVVHAGSDRARHAGRYYIVLVVIGEVCIISALMLLASRAPTDFGSLRAAFLAEGAARNDVIIGLLFAGFGIKAGLVGLHFWLPLAHPVAPAPASAVLSGAMIKAGLIGWMRLLPLGETAFPAWGAALAAAGLITACYGVLAGLPQREAKTVLAYSSVSQMGAMTMAVGLGLAYPDAWPILSATVLMYMVHHGLVKGGLFLGAGLVQHPLRPSAAHVVGAILVVGALALAGAPLTGGLLAKLALKHGASHVGEPWAASLPILLGASSALTAMLMLRFLWLAWPRPVAEAGRVPVRLFAPWLALAAGWLVVPWMLAEPVLRAEAIRWPAAWSAILPLAIAGTIAGGLFVLRRAGRCPAMPRVPPGDLGIPLERGVAAVACALARFSRNGVPQAVGTFRSGAAAALRAGPGLSALLGQGEARIGAWSITGVLVLLLAASFAWLLS